MDPVVKENFIRDWKRHGGSVTTGMATPEDERIEAINPTPLPSPNPKSPEEINKGMFARMNFGSF